MKIIGIEEMMKHLWIFCLAFMLGLGRPAVAADPNTDQASDSGQSTSPFNSIFGTPSSPALPPQQPQPTSVPTPVAAQNALPANTVPPVSAAAPSAPSRMFGAQLFNGSFRNLIGGGFNPNYQINVGDRIQVRMWGGFVFDGFVPVDPQGNIFLPNIGPIAVAGTPNGQLNELVTAQVRRVFKANVGVYAALDASQPVKVFVTGFVRQPGLYAGVSSESLLSYLDRAGGVDPDKGSYVDVVVKRAGQVRMHANLYDFLLNGHLDFVQLQDGDTIVVGPRKFTFSASGEVFNANDFEFTESEIPLEKALALTRLKPGATHVSVVRKQGAVKRSEYYPLNKVSGMTLQDGDSLNITSDRYDGTIQVRIEGAHSGEHAIVLPYGSTMADVISQIKPNAMSRMDAIQLFRQSVADRQKEMLNVALSKLEEAAYSARSKTLEEASLRTKEAELISKFVEKARAAQPKGQVILDQASLGKTLLEDGDVIQIPERTSLVMVHGEVLFPNAVSWRPGLSTDDYIREAGGYTQNANTSKVILLRQNGETLQGHEKIEAGDEIMVLPRIDSKNIEVARGITQIIYQIAVATKLLLTL